MTNMIRSITEALVLEVADRFSDALPSERINKDIIYQPIDIALRERAERQVDSKTAESAKYDLEFINVWLEDLVYAKSRRRIGVSRFGPMTSFNDPNSKTFVKMHRAVPADLTYSITFWTKYKDRMDTFLQEFTFWQEDNPNVGLYYEEDKRLEFDIIVDPATVSAEQVKSMFIEGKYWRYTVNILVEAWILRNVEVRTAKEIQLEAYIADDLKTKEAANKFLDQTITSDTFLSVAQLVGDLTDLTAHELAIKKCLNDAGHAVTQLETIDLAIADTHDVVVVGYAHDGVDLSTIKPTTAGILMVYANDSFGFGDPSTKTTRASQYANLYNNQHFITDDYALGEVQINEATPQDTSGYSTYGGQEVALAEIIMAMCDKEETLFDGTKAAGRRTLYGNWQFAEATENGKIFLLRALQWAGSKDFAYQGS